MSEPKGDYSIRVANLSKVYRVYPRPLDMLREIVQRSPHHTEFAALRDVSFEVKRGDVMGIIGLNGSGKSTLLKIITGTLDKTAGEVDVRGRVSAILELGTGFHPEYTGRENILTGGLCLGMTRDEVMRKMDGIIDFSGLREFIDRPFKTYSSGMQARLTFATATSIDPDILIIDEALAAGDAAFVQRSFSRIRQICKSGCTALLVSHSTGMLGQVCNRVLWLDQGSIHMIGDPLSVIRQYDLNIHHLVSAYRNPVRTGVEPGDSSRAGASKSEPGIRPMSEFDPATLYQAAPHSVFRAGPVIIERVELLNQHGQATRLFSPWDSLVIRAHYRCDGEIPDDTLGMAMSLNRKADLLAICHGSSANPDSYEDTAHYNRVPFRKKPSHAGVMEARLQPLQLAPGEYLVSLGLLPGVPGNLQFYEYHHFAYEIAVHSGGASQTAGFVYPLVHWSHNSSNGVYESPTAGAVKPADWREHLLQTTQEPGQYKSINEEIDSVCFREGGYPNGWLRHQHCPCCLSTRIISAFLKFNLEHWVCGECDFVFLNPYPPPQLLDRLYNAAYYPAVRRFVELPKAKAGREDAALFSYPISVMLRIIEEARSSVGTGRWLEVGGGIGSFAHLVQQRLPDWSVFFNETNRVSLDAAREAYGLATLSDSPAELKARGLEFDVISAIDVLEHTPDPCEFVRQYLQVLRPGGILVIGVPRFSRLNRLISQESSSAVIPPYHLSLFNEHNLVRLLNRAGPFENVRVWVDGIPAFTLLDFVKTWQHWDIKVPDAIQDQPTGVQVTPYPEHVSRWLNALGAAYELTRDLFLEVDGGSLLTVIARKK